MKTTFLIPLVLSASSLFGQSFNLARYQATSADSSSGGTSSQLAIDGVVSNDRRWISGTAGSSHWMSVQFPLYLQFGSAHVYLGKDDQFPVSNFSLQYWNGSRWADIPGSVVTNNTKTELNLVFTQTVTANSIRFFTTDSVARVKELALFPPSASSIPLGTGVVVDLARQHHVSSSSKLGGFPASNAVDGFVDDSSRWVSTNTSGPHTLTVDLDTTARVAGVQVYSGFSNQSGTQARNFRIEYWNGTSWVTAPGGAVSNNAAFAREVRFSSIVSTSELRLVVTDTGFARISEFVVLPATNGATYKINEPVTVSAPPGIGFTRYADTFYSLVGSNGQVLTGSTSSLGLARDVKGEDQQFQVLLNVGTDTFRIRNRRSGLHLTVRGASKLNGAPVDLSAYSALPHQHWRLVSTGSGQRLVNVWSGLGLDAANSQVAQRSGSAATQVWRISKVTHYPKKGLAGWEGYSSRFGAKWNYNWGLGSKGFGTDINFSPMRWGNHGWGNLPTRFPGWHRRSKPTLFMGFNEPDNKDQSNIPVETALKLWPRLERANLPMVGPGLTNPWNNWSQAFMDRAAARGLRIDYTAIHWYGAPSPDTFMNLLSGINWRYKKPVWVTEFSCVDWSGRGNWNYKDNYRFFAEVLWRMERANHVKRYSVFLFTGSATSKRSNIFKNSKRELSPVGELYAGWDADTTVRTNKPYFLTNRSTVSHIQVTRSTTPLAATVFVNDASVQWVLLPARTLGNVYVVSLQDGRRLQTDGTTVNLAAAGTEGSAVEWRYVAAGKGWNYLNHPGTNKRLRESGGTFSMVSTSTTWDSTKWFFVRPHKSTPVPEQFGLSCGSGTIGWDGPTRAGGTFAATLRTSTLSGAALLLVSARPGAVSLDSLGMTGCVSGLDLGSGLIGIFATRMTLGQARVSATLPNLEANAYLQYVYEQPGLNRAGLGATKSLKIQIVR